jgi:class 3 adenylate cyclase
VSGSASKLSHLLPVAAWTVALALPLVGIFSLLLRAHLDPEWSRPRLHFVLFLAVGGGAIVLAQLAGQAAERRGDARVLLLSLAFLVTGGFLAVHALGTPGVLLNDDLPGFKVAIPVGLLFAAIFAAASALVDLRPTLAAAVVQHRAALRTTVIAAMIIWMFWALLEIPPLAGATDEGAGNILRSLAALGALTYALSAIRYIAAFRRRMTLLPASVITCFILLAEALVGSALVGERTWHASWWEWHVLIVTAYAIIVYAAYRQWSDERFHQLYLPTTRERTQTVTVLFADLVSFTTFTEASPPLEVAGMLSTYYEMATPLLSREFGGDVEKFIGDAVMATFNTRGDQPDHAMRAAGAGLELQRRMNDLTTEHPRWPRLRVGINTGAAVVREMGGAGYMTYPVVGDPVNVASRLQDRAPAGGVLIGAETYRRLPAGTPVDAQPGLEVKGKRTPVDAYLLHTLPSSFTETEAGTAGQHQPAARNGAL